MRKKKKSKNPKKIHVVGIKFLENNHNKAAKTYYYATDKPLKKGTKLRVKSRISGGDPVCEIVIQNSKKKEGKTEILPVSNRKI